MLQRRAALAALLLALTPLCTLAQSARTFRVGFLGLGPASSWDREIQALRSGLRDHGYAEGKDLLLEFRWATAVDELPALAAELVRLPVDVIVAPASTQVEPARRATRTIPIVFAQHADPVGTGHVASLARPGGNITGVSMLLTDVAAKGLQLLSEVIPNASRIGLLWNPTTPTHPHVVKVISAMSDRLGIQLVMAPVRTVQDFEGAFVTMVREKAGGFLVPTSPLTNSQTAALAELSLKHKLPGMFGNRANVLAGGLMSYGANFVDMYRRAASYVDKILRGTKPADLPVEQASKYQLTINRKTADAIGITIPQSVWLRADEVIS